MWFPDWLRNVCNQRIGRPKRKPIAFRFRPQLETLEERAVPAQISLTVRSLADSGPATLRAAILTADAGSNSDKFKIEFAVTGTIDLHSPLPDLNNSIAITGPGANRLTIERAASASFASAILTVDAGKTASLWDLTISHGDNGGIFNNGTLALARCTLAGNSSSGSGGALYNESMLTVTDCMLSGNSAAGGGAIENDGTLLVTHSTLSGNSTGPFGGGFGGAIDNNGAVTITQSTLSGNSAPFGAGGAISNSRTLAINQSTLSGNSALGGTGGAIALFSLDGALEINQTLLSGNSANTATLNGTVFVGRGGAIANDGAMAVTIKQSILCGNSADHGQGGAIYNLNGTVTIKQNFLFDNSANGGQGGAIFNSSNGDFGTLGTTIINQSSVFGNSASAGGGIYNDVGGVLTVLGDSIVVANSAPRGAGADLYNTGLGTLIESFVGSIAGSGTLTIR